MGTNRIDVNGEELSTGVIPVAFEVAIALRRWFTGTPARWYASPARLLSLSKLPGLHSLAAL